MAYGIRLEGRTKTGSRYMVHGARIKRVRSEDHFVYGLRRNRKRDKEKSEGRQNAVQIISYIDRSNQVWATDITYIPMAHGFMYLVAIMDWHSRKIPAWRISNTLDLTSVLTRYRRL